MSTFISSPKNPRIKQVIALRERRERDLTGLTRVEGFEELSFVVNAGLRPTALFFCPSLFHSAREGELLEHLRRSGVELTEVSEEVFDRLAYREGADGWLALVTTPNYGLEDIRLRDPAFLLVVDAVEKPGNLGAILRTAEAAGVDALISADPVTDWGNPNIVRASKGAVFGMLVATAGSDPTIDWLQSRAVKMIVATPQAEVVYTDADLSGPVALVLGSEKYGVSQSWLDRADQAVRIPMFGRIDSLNVSTAAALLIYEVVRQRAEPTAGSRDWRRR